MSVRAIFNRIGANYLRSFTAALILLFLFPILGYKYSGLFSQGLNIYLLTLFILMSNVFGIYIGEGVNYVIYRYVKWRYFKDSKSFTGFPPWEAWKDNVFRSYKQELLSRVYFITSLLLTALFYPYYTHFKTREFYFSINLADAEIDRWELFLLYSIILILLLFPTISLIYLKRGRFLWRKPKENTTYISNLFTSEIESIKSVKEILNDYLDHYSFYEENRIVANLKMIAIMYTNMTSLSNLEILKMKLSKKQEENKEKEDTLSKTFWEELNIFQIEAKLASEHLIEGNFNTAKLQFIVTIRRLQGFLVNVT